MKVKIKKKQTQTLKLNTASEKNPPHGKNPINKVVNIELPIRKIHRYYKEYNICVLRPAIDKIVLRYDVLKDIPTYDHVY